MGWIKTIAQFGEIMSFGAEKYLCVALGSSHQADADFVVQMSLI